jgi:uncharacterized repeat protein (TIGR03803 family)
LRAVQQLKLDTAKLSGYLIPHYMKLTQRALSAVILAALYLATPPVQGTISLTPLFSFGSGYTNTDGTSPSAGLVQGKDGNLYGTAPSGGTNNLGTVFQISTNGAYTTLVTFTGTNGAFPAAGLIQGADGNFYGTTTAGGTYDLGTVFKMTSGGTLVKLASFNDTNGASPAATLVQTPNGVLYGVTQYGGANDYDSGTVFKITTNGVLTRLYSFTGDTDGGNSTAGLALGKDGNLYGTTPYGGADYSGSVFKVTTNGVLTTLYSFTGGNDGSSPDAAVIQGKDGNLYGTTASGGAYDADSGGDGTIFKMTTAGALTTLTSFNNTNGSDPEAVLVQGVDGILYGTTAYGGSDGLGTLFKITTNGAFTALITFHGANGAQPQAGLVQGTDSYLYGTTVANGPVNLVLGNGTVFKATTNGALSTLYIFGDNNPNGAQPAARLAGANGVFYGTTVFGGTNHGGFGTVFMLATNGTHTTLASFSGTNGAYPQAALVAGSDGNFYGTTAYGGANNTTNGGDGTVFRVTTNGVLTVLASLGTTNGANPIGDLAQGPDGNFYGTAQNGGTNNVANGGNGTVFRITTNGILARLASFRSTNGANPAAGLTLGPDGNLYGTASYGGTNDLASGGDGTVFRVTTNGTLTRLISFGDTNGANPQAGLTLYTNGSFYGTTAAGGAIGAGTVFKITTNGTFTSLYSFSGGNDGATPTAPLVLGADGNFYGTTSNGGTNYNGVAFQITPDGVFTPLYSLTGGSDGANPVAGLVEGAPSHFYGAAEFGGTNGAGTLFHLFVDPFPSIVTPPSDLAVFAGATASFSVAAIGAAPLKYQWQRAMTNLTDQGNVSGSGTSTLNLSNVALADAAGYSIIVSNTYGAVTSAVATLTVRNPFAPTVSTDPATEVGVSSATLNASVNPDGAATTAWFLWGLTSDYGSTTAATNLDSGGDTLSVALNLPGLLAFTEYHFAAVAGNSLGTNTGSDLSFLTPGARSNITFTLLASLDGGTNGGSPQAGLWQGADGNLYGTTYYGGDYDDGTVFKLTTNGVLTTLLSFNGTNGSHPAAGLAPGANGFFYGTTYGTNDPVDEDNGTVFKITTNGVFTSLVSFNGTNGANPAAALAQGPDGNYYGTAEFGGAYDPSYAGNGTVFKTTTNGVLTSLVSFNGTNGANPAGGLALGTNGLLYGTTSGGGDNDSGTVFSITTNGTLTTLYSFTGGGDGSDPEAGLVQGLDGNFYGTTYAGGDYDQGTVFEITAAGALTTLYSFTGDTDGSSPDAGLEQDADGNLYGTTSSGGVDGNGTVFLITPGGAFATLVLFDSTVYGAGSQAGLLLGADGSFYGTAAFGGTNGSGTVFRMQMAPLPSILTQPSSLTNFAGTTALFTVAAIGAPPLSYRWQRGSTNLTDQGNIAGSRTSTLTVSNMTQADAGTYAVVLSNATGTATSTVATLTVINPFPPSVTTEPASSIGINSATFNSTVVPDGAATTAWFYWGLTTDYGNASAVTNVGSGGDPVSVSLDVPGLLPFTAYHFAAAAANALGTNTGADMAFMTPGARSGITFTPLLSFGGTNGSDAQAGVVQAPDGNFYGTTYEGGDNDLGTVYQLTPGGTLKVLFSFDGTNGSNPEADLVLGPDGQLYGTTYDGGTNDVDNGGDGTVFKITTNGLFTALVSFNGTNGANPAAGLALGPDGLLYGTTQNGGTNNVAMGGLGTVFKITTTGILTTLVSFDFTNGANPWAQLTLANDGNFYGTADGGGIYNVMYGGYGTVFKITTNGTLTCLASFNGTNGAYPVAALVQGTDGYLYGTTQYGGTNDVATGGLGTIFRITTNGSLTSLYSFTGGIDGFDPQAPLTFGTDGNLYGTTSEGGVGGNGTVFQFTPGGTLSTLVLFDYDSYGASPAAGLFEGADGGLYGTAPSGGTNGSGTVYRLSLPPAPPVFQTPTETNGTLTLTWSTAKGQTYQLQYRTNLNATNWTTLLSLTATNSTATASDTLNAAGQRFYRVVLTR